MAKTYSHRTAPEVWHFLKWEKFLGKGRKYRHLKLRTNHLKSVKQWSIIKSILDLYLQQSSKLLMVLNDKLDRSLLFLQPCQEQEERHTESPSHGRAGRGRSPGEWVHTWLSFETPFETIGHQLKGSKKTVSRALPHRFSTATEKWSITKKHLWLIN